MAKKRLLASQQLASDEETEEEDPPKSKTHSRGKIIDNFILPAMGQKYISCMESGMDLNLLQKGASDSFQFQGTVAGQLTQPIYELIKTDSLTLETLENNRKWKKESAEVEYSYLTRRYYSEDKKVVRDRRRGNKIVCEPACMFHLIICSHLLNNHLSAYSVHRNLIQTYANVTRDFIVTAIRYCTKCKPNQEIIPFKKVRHKNVFWELLPLERIHVEIFQPFSGAKIEKRYSFVLYCRDYHSRYIWLLPLKNGKRKYLVPTLATFLLNLARVPMYLETTTIDRDDLFDVCGQIAEMYDIKVGLGVKNSKRFHNIGIRDMQQLLEDHREECLKDWNMCLLHGPFYINQRSNISSDGIPVDLQYCAIPDCSKKFQKKRDEIISELPPANIVQIGKGMLYLENDNNGDKSAGESEDFTDNFEEEHPQDIGAQHAQEEENQEQRSRRNAVGNANGRGKNKNGLSASQLIRNKDKPVVEKSRSKFFRHCQDQDESDNAGNQQNKEGDRLAANGGCRTQQRQDIPRGERS